MRSFLFAFLIATLFTLVLNAQSLAQWANGSLTIASLTEHAIDERYYLATIAKVGNGGPVMGHASFLEHRSDAPSASLAPAAEGLLMRWLHLPLPLTLLLGDLLFPFLAVLLLTLGLRSLTQGSILLSGALAVIINSDIGTYWFRSANPQIPFVFVAAWIAVTFAFPLSSRRSLLLKGLLIGLLSWVHLVYASFFIIADGVLLLAEAIRRRSFLGVIPGGLLYGLSIAICLLPRFFLTLPRDVALDTFYRLGIIHSHAPAAPYTQVLIVGIIGVLLLHRWHNKRWPSEGLFRCFFILVAALVALNQAVIHGIDATFVSYYQPLIRIFLILAIVGSAVALLHSMMTSRLVVIGMAILSIVGLGFSVQAIKAQTRMEADRLAQSDVPRVMAWLRTQPGPLVIAGPNILNERIPAETPHYVLFNEYGWNQPVSDRELAERYALQVRLIPSSIAKEKTYTFVFGGHAGLQAAKERTLCKVLRAIGGTDDDCQIDARTLIRHQELLPIVDEARIDIAEALKRFHVTSVITEGEDKGEIPSFCRSAQVIGSFTIWRCV